MEELVKRCEEADGADRELDRDIIHALWDGPDRDSFMHHAGKSPPPFSASIDAALTLVPPKSEWIVEAYNSNGVKADHVRASAWVQGAARCFAATPALAVCAAALRARTHA